MPYPLKKLGEVVNFSQGIQVPIEKQFQEKKEGCVRFLRIIDFTQGNQEERFVENLGERYFVGNDDLSMVRYGNPGMICRGYSGILANNLFKIIPIIDIDKNYLYYFFKNPLFLSYIESQWTGAAMKAISFRSLNNLQIPLPPLPTQKAIVQKLDEAFARIDASIELAEKSLKAIEEGNASVLEEVFGSGEYEEKSVEQISENIQYGYTGKTTSKGKVRYLRITDIQNNTIHWEDVPFVEIEEREISKYSLNCGDIVFARTGATVGKSCLIDENGIGNIFASYLIRIVSKLDLIFPEYLQYFFYSHKYWEQIGLDVVGAAQPNFNGTKLKQIKLPLPPLSKQKEIVEYLDRVFAVHAELRRAYEEKIHSLKELKQSLLREAFEGRLVP